MSILSGEDSEATGTGGATINRYQATLKTILKLSKQPTDIFKPFKERKGRIRVVTKDEEQTTLRLLRDTAKPIYLEAADLIECLLDTGCRLSELLTSTYKDNIDFEASHIRIWVNKGDKPRSVPMTTRVKSILLARQKATKPFAITKYQADKCWAWVRKQMGLEAADNDFVIHSCRHTCASRLVNAGVDLYVVKEWLGHSTIKITERYAHLDPGKLAHAVEALER